MGDENTIRTLGDYSKPSHEGYMNTIELPVGNSVIFYDHIDGTTQKGIDYAESERLRKLSPNEAWATIKRLAQYEDEGWNDALTLDEMSLNFKNLDIEQLLGIMERKVDALMTDAVSYDPLHKGVTFRLGGVEREMSLLKFGWRVGLYFERESRNVATLSGLRKAETVNSIRETHSIWHSIGDGMFNVGNTKAQSIMDPRIKLAHRCITMTITGTKETTNRVTVIDLFYLYCIFGEGVVCNIPYWLAKYLKGIRDKAMIFN
ncbi:hypothetical protein Tco_0939181 [Tanacetum coccineum]|uniref:Uncharacterized protein n=1 Tax=Tanacetum coccineum TaxID=301880 RepID=A0ABQ5DM17_9ASTR